MHQFRENTIQAFGEAGEFLTADLITSPIRRLINCDAERAGIDLHNSRRTVASLLGSGGMGAALGAVLGPPGSLLGGLFGYVAAIGSEYEGDRIENDVDTEEAALYVLELKTLQIAAEVLQDNIDAETWDEICEEIEYETERLSAMPDPPESLDDTVDLMFDIVSEGIAIVDYEAYTIFLTAYNEACRELCF